MRIDSSITRRTWLAAAFVVAIAGAGTARADDTTPAGLWRNIDDETKQPKALVRITEANGVYSGKIEKILTDKPDARCEACTDERKDQPVQGMTIITGIRKSDSTEGQFDGGSILDPNNGKVYRCRIRMADGGKKLEVRGYIGAPLIGRTQTWIREQ